MVFPSQTKTIVSSSAILWLLLCTVASNLPLCCGKATNDADDLSRAKALATPIPNTRSERFPSIASRIKLYMSNWYSPPCENDSDAFVHYSFHSSDSDEDWPKLDVVGFKDHPSVNQTMRKMTSIQSTIEPDMLFFMDEGTIVNCANFSYDEKWGEQTKDPYRTRIHFRQNMRMYCQDIKELLLPAWNHLRLEGKSIEEEPKVPPTLFQFGDNKQSHVFKDVQVPHIKKFRSAAVSQEALETSTRPLNGTCHNSRGVSIRQPLASTHGSFRFQPIVWKLATNRHYRHLYNVYRYDRSWSRKKDMAVFMGQLTGSRDGYNKYASDDENCHNMKRCRLVYNHANSTLIYARLTSTRGRLPDVLNGVELLADKVKLDKLLEFKAIIMLEGNDVASGLKWALLSQSIVMMPPPKHTSWCMEELLEPWIHYVPIDENLTNVEERMQWVVDHPEEAQKISERATLWMEDLVFHPDASQDDRIIQEAMLKRYEAHFWHPSEIQ